MTTTASLRERKKEATRQALHEAAVRLATERGLGNVTVEAIAEAAKVSRRTFSNYFSGKEDAVLYGDAVLRKRLHRLLAERPATEPAWTALSRAAERLIDETDADPAWVAQVSLLRRHPALMARHAANNAASERSLAELIAPRLSEATTLNAPPGDADGRRTGEPGLDTDTHARLLAATLESALRLAAQHWLDHPGSSPRHTLRRILAAAGNPWQ